METALAIEFAGCESSRTTSHSIALSSCIHLKSLPGALVISWSTASRFKSAAAYTL